MSKHVYPKVSYCLLPLYLLSLLLVVAALGTGVLAADPGRPSELDRAYDAFSDNQFDAAITGARSVIAASADQDICAEAVVLVVHSVWLSQGYDAALAETAKLKASAKGKPVLDGLDESEALMKAEYSSSQQATAEQTEAARKASDPAVAAQISYQLAELRLVHGQSKDAAAALDSVISSYPASVPAWNAIRRRTALAGAQSGQEVQAKESPKDQSRLDDGIDAFCENRLSDAVKIATELLASPDGEVRAGSINLLILSVNSQSGYQSALTKAWSLSTGAETIKPTADDVQDCLRVVTYLTRNREAALAK